MNQKASILVISPEIQVQQLMDRTLRTQGYSVTVAAARDEALSILEKTAFGLTILSEKQEVGSWKELGQELFKRNPAMPIILFCGQQYPELMNVALKEGLAAILTFPLHPDDVIQSVDEVLKRAKLRRDWAVLDARRATASLEEKLGELETLSQLGQSITSSLDLDSVLTEVVATAVKLTGSEEGSLLLQDEASGELYMRAAKNFNEDFVRTFRLPLQDSLAGQVLQTCQPAVIDGNSPQKIKTSYLVHSLAYVPLQIKEHAIGVLGVDNRSPEKKSFSERNIRLLTALAGYAAIAIENARLFTETNLERNKLEIILSTIQDGVMVLDEDQKIILANPIAKNVLGLKDPYLQQPASEVIHQGDLLALLGHGGKSQVNYVELDINETQIYAAQLAPIVGVGMAITLHDITFFKKIDRLKNEFVSTVSHDLRSPLTAILGYVELLEKVGPLSEIQRDFVHRVQSGVGNVTELVDSLLNWGRMENGIDLSKETVSFDVVVRDVAEQLKSVSNGKNQKMEVVIAHGIKQIGGSELQLRQLAENLIENAIKYTPQGGKVRVQLTEEHDQLILKVADTGVGIPAADLPNIFDKYYRGENVTTNITGTGLGLAIVKSIVENHRGRIWVDSTEGVGTLFTVVFPAGPSSTKKSS